MSGKMIRIAGRGQDGTAKALAANNKGVLLVQLSGSDMEIYGASINDRPAADTVPVGVTFTIVDATQEFNSWISDGTTWGDEV